jgi:hypothetical protein
VHGALYKLATHSAFSHRVVCVCILCCRRQQRQEIERKKIEKIIFNCQDAIMPGNSYDLIPLKEYWIITNFIHSLYIFSMGKHINFSAKTFKASSSDATSEVSTATREVALSTVTVTHDHSIDWDLNYAELWGSDSDSEDLEQEELLDDTEGRILATYFRAYSPTTPAELSDSDDEEPEIPTGKQDVFPYNLCMLAQSSKRAYCYNYCTTCIYYGK